MDVKKSLQIAYAVNGTTQKSIAKKIDVSETTLSKISNGKTDPRISTLTKIADGLDMKLSKLIALSEKGGEYVN